MTEAVNQAVDIDINTLSESDITIDKINQDWSIHQLKRGHRYSTDDLMTAWVAWKVAGEVPIHADIGAGIGSCGLLTLWKQPQDTRLVMIEAQRISHELAKKTIQLNHLENRVDARYGDLRDPKITPERNFFPLITGTPPYFPIDKALSSPHPQRAACRMELRGNVYDYAETAARIMKDDGWFVCCHAGNDPRLEAAMIKAGLHVIVRQDIVFREGKSPTISIVAARKSSAQREDWKPIVIRDQSGQEKDYYNSIREEMGHILE